MTEDNEGMWAIVEILGHKKRAGFVQKSEQFGAAMLRIDLPATPSHEAATQFYGLDSIYCITPVSEEIARAAASAMRANPISVYMPQLPSPSSLSLGSPTMMISISNQTLRYDMTKLFADTPSTDEAIPVEVLEGDPDPTLVEVESILSAPEPEETGLVESIDSDARHAEAGALMLLHEYGQLDAMEKRIKARKAEIKDVVIDTIEGEAENDHKVRVGGFRFEITRRRNYDDRRKDVEREVTINGQTFIATLRQLDEEKKKLDAYTKRDEFRKEDSIAVTVKPVQV